MNSTLFVMDEYGAASHRPPAEMRRWTRL